MLNFIFYKGIKALILVPTRELCEQVNEHFLQLSSYCKNINIYSMAGDSPLNEQKYYFY